MSAVKVSSYVLPSFEDRASVKEIEVGDLKKCAYIRTISKIHFLLLLPVLGWIALAATVYIRRQWHVKLLNADETALYKLLMAKNSGLSSYRAAMLAKFIANIKEKKPKETTIYQSNNFLVDGSVPRRVIVLPTGEVIVNVFNKIAVTEKTRISRGLLIKPDNTVVTVHIKVKKVRQNPSKMMKIVDSYLPIKPDEGTTERVKPLRCYVIRSDSDLKQLYPRQLSDEEAQQSPYVDIAFHAAHRGRNLIARGVNLIQNIGSRGYRNRSVTHVDIVQGRKKDKNGNDVLSIISATGVVGTVIAYDYNPNQSLKNFGRELHIMRFKRDEIEGMDAESLGKYILEFANRQVDHSKSPSSRESRELMQQLEQDQKKPNLYSYSDGMKSIIMSKKWNNEAMSRIAVAVTNEILKEPFKTLKGKHIGVFCSTFAAIAYQVGIVRATLKEEYFKKLVSDARLFAINSIKDEWNKLCKQLKTEDLNPLEIIEDSITDEEQAKKIIEYIDKQASEIQDRQRKAQITVINHLIKTRIKKYCYDNLVAELTNRDSSLQNPIQTDPLFKTNSRWILPSTLHGMMIEQADSIQIVPPAQ